MPIGTKRNRILYGLGARRSRTHRYTQIRWALGVAFTVGVALLPLTDTLRFDLWDGRHHVLGEQVGLVEAAKAFAFPFLAVNVAIVFVSRFLGRYLCGFVCPVGNLNRLAEWMLWRHRKTSLGRWRGALGMLVVCFLLAAITFSFWVDWHVFVEGSALAVSLAAAFLLGTTLVLFGSIWWLGMRFCSDWCPSGIYFAVLGPESLTGVEFAHPENCTECKACSSVCPVNLEPTQLLGGEARDGLGLYPDGLSPLANCLRCGDCVNVCEETGAGATTTETPLRLGFLPRDAGGATEGGPTALVPPPGSITADRAEDADDARRLSGEAS